MDQGGPNAAPPGAATVLVPVKAFTRAKQRLAGRLDPAARSSLARALADRVLAAAAPLPVTVVCDDDEVATWARDAGASVCWTPGTDLNGALSVAVDRAAAAGVGRVVIAHADLPFASALGRFAAPVADVLVVPDRHGDGTNVMSLPTAPRFAFAYGPGSRQLHLDAARAAGLSAEEHPDEALGWDVDEAADLSPPGSLGVLPLPPSGCASAARR